MEFLNNTIEFAHFYGSETITVYGHVYLTEGALYLAEKYECFWLMDTIDALQKKLVAEEFQCWTLKRVDNAYYVIADDGNVSDDEQQTNENNGRILYSKKLEFCDFKAQAVKLYCVNGVIMLPKEY